MRITALLLMLAPLFLHQASAQANWDYLENGNDWEGPGNGECGDNVRQSPIDISDDLALENVLDERLEVNWAISKDADVGVVNTGSSLVYNFVGPNAEALPGLEGSLRWKGQTYRLLQMHFHAASEHTWEGARRDVELHFVHQLQSATGELGYAVTGLTWSASHLISSTVPESPFLKAILESAAKVPNKGNTATIKFPPEAGLNVGPVDDVVNGNIQTQPHIFRSARPGVPNDVAGITDVNDARVQRSLSSWRNFYHYAGSLTTPPCLQVVQWFVQQRAILAPYDQVEAVHALFQYPGTQGNWREVQNNANAQEVYKIRMAWSPERLDPVLSNVQKEEQVSKAQTETVTKSGETTIVINGLPQQQTQTSSASPVACEGTTEQVEGWVIAISVLLPTLFLASVMFVLHLLGQYKAGKDAEQKVFQVVVPGEDKETVRRRSIPGQNA